jgi:hypothetical protein
MIFDERVFAASWQRIISPTLYVVPKTQTK